MAEPPRYVRLASVDGQLRDDFIGRRIGGEPPVGPPDMLEPRVARLEADVAELKADVKGIRTDLADLRENVAALPTRADLRNWTLAIISITVASVIAVGFGVGALVQNSVTVAQAGMANQLSAFQAGLSAIQAAAQREAPQPIIIQVPPPPAPARP